MIFNANNVKIEWKQLFSGEQIQIQPKPNENPNVFGLNTSDIKSKTIPLATVASSAHQKKRELKVTENNYPKRFSIMCFVLFGFVLFNLAVCFAYAIIVAAQMKLSISPKNANKA